MVGGPAGEGVLSASHALAKVFARAGLHVATDGERPSLIRGGHNYNLIRAEQEKIGSKISLIDALVAMDKQTVLLHANRISHNGAVVYDGEEFQITPEELGRSDLRLLALPTKSIIKELGADPHVENTVALGALLGLLDADLNLFLDVLKEEYVKHPDILKFDLEAARRGYDLGKAHDQFTHKITTIPGKKRLLLNGIQAINLGALKAGVQFVAMYPITPATGILEGLVGLGEKQQIVVIQPEDEISVITMATGAAYAGARTLVGTSGPGYALMGEGISLAGMMEAPVVIVNSQRGGPATGLPTRTAQEDLQFVLHAGHGEFPHFVIAPHDSESCYLEIQRAFNLAERFQTPVTLLIDRFLAESLRTVDEFPTDLTIDRGQVYSQEELDRIGQDAFRRFGNPQGGVCKRSLPGMRNGVHRLSADEHDETGTLKDAPDNRKRMVDRRAKKLVEVLKELPVPKLDGSSNAQATLVSWGSMKPVIDDARKFLARENIATAHLHLTYLRPFHDQEILNILSHVTNPILIEQNATGQLGQLIREKTGFKIAKQLLKYDGLQFLPEELAERIKTLL